MTEIDLQVAIMWCMMAAPLISGNDLRSMSSQTLGILANKEVVAIDQDSLGIQGFRQAVNCLLYTSPSPRDRQKSRMPSSA